jgi:hypothetical protein
MFLFCSRQVGQTYVLPKKISINECLRHIIYILLLTRKKSSFRLKLKTPT